MDLEDQWKIAKLGQKGYFVDSRQLYHKNKSIHIFIFINIVMKI